MTDTTTTEVKPVETEKLHESYLKQVTSERLVAEKHLQSKITEWLKRLKLYNNQRRDKEAVGDPLLFTVFNTVFAALYDDKLNVEFTGKESGDEETADNLNSLAENDYDEMEKDVFDYEWDWDTCFFGRGIAMYTYFDRDSKTPIPEVVDPCTFLRDPRAASINGNKMGKNKARFFGRYVKMTKLELSNIPGVINLDQLKFGEKINSLVDKARTERANAQGLDEQKKINESDFGDNAEYELLEWFTTHDGKKVCGLIGNDGTLVLRYITVKDLVGHDNHWPAVDRCLYPMAHDWDGVSIPDLVEDKQRKRSITQNLAIKIMESDLEPMYLFDKSRVKNKADILNFERNKFIEIDGQGDVRGAVQPLNKATTDKNLIDYILNTLDSAAQRATATPEIQQGALSSERRTASELNLVAAKVDTRYSLSAKIFGWSEKRFWIQWYQIYKKHFKDIDQKVIRINGAFGTKWRPLTKENIVAKIDPDVKVESRVLSEAKKNKQKNDYVTFLAFAMKDPNMNMRYAVKRLGQLNGLKKDELDRILPPTIDELQAEAENDELNDNKMIKVLPTDNHTVHLEIHNKAAETPSKFAHVETHKKALLLKRDNPSIFPDPQPTVNPNNPAGANSPDVTIGQNGNSVQMKQPSPNMMALQ